MSPKHSIDFCPVCGGGLCGIRICGVDNRSRDELFAITASTEPHGLIVCDECEAIWLEPDICTSHQYTDIEHPKCPICQASLWGASSRWANAGDIELLNWQYAVNPDLDVSPDEGLA